MKTFILIKVAVIINFLILSCSHNEYEQEQGSTSKASSQEDLKNKLPSNPKEFIESLHFSTVALNRIELDQMRHIQINTIVDFKSSEPKSSKQERLFFEYGFEYSPISPEQRGAILQKPEKVLSSYNPPYMIRWSQEDEFVREWLSALLQKYYLLDDKEAKNYLSHVFDQES